MVYPTISITHVLTLGLSGRYYIEWREWNVSRVYIISRNQPFACHAYLLNVFVWPHRYDQLCEVDQNLMPSDP